MDIFQEQWGFSLKNAIKFLGNLNRAHGASNRRLTVLLLIITLVFVPATLALGACSSSSGQDIEEEIEVPETPQQPETPKQPEVIVIDNPNPKPYVPVQPVTPSSPFFEPSKAKDCDNIRWCENRVHELYYATSNDVTLHNSLRSQANQLNQYQLMQSIQDRTKTINDATLEAWKNDKNAKFHATFTNGGFSMEHKYDYRVEVGTDGLKRVPCFSSKHLRAGAQAAIDYYEQSSSYWKFIKDNNLSDLYGYVYLDK